jgi:hypothetical protein
MIIIQTPRKKLSVYSGVDSKSIDADPFSITPLPHFKWQETEPLKFRAFKPKYHLTMSGFSSVITNFMLS